MYFRECPHCGCHLDPGEKCECQAEAAEKAELIKRSMYLDQKTNQYGINIKTAEKIPA